MKQFASSLLTLLILQGTLASCNGQSASQKNKPTAVQNKKTFTEGTDYLLYERIRILDKTGFDQPQEAFSMLLPKGWKHTAGIIWNNPGTMCAGTYRQLSAASADGTYHFDQLPDMIFGWNTNQQLMQMNQGNSGGKNCGYRQPMDAYQYLNTVLLAQIGNPKVISSIPNESVVNDMRKSNEKVMRELQQYGAGQMQFYQTAITAQVQWPDGREGYIVLGANILETVVPNIYNGTSDRMYTTQITQQSIFSFPGAQREQAKDQLSVIMSSVHTNPAWSEAVNKFWKDVRTQSNIVHIGRIKMMDERTRQIGRETIAKGNQRLNDMDNQMRSWEQKQNSQDRMHTEFIKTIREVENYSDASGKYEMTSGYDHAWSRGDGNTFIMTNNPNFDPSSVYQDQSWKEMKKVD
ncbi:hypothetical protein [Ferruginibacter sp. HRS2-29]|uniref:hypothetical protein n=1 Tax=Ferruginibacter sp. HRS2-29 TaxID=2487334 RepID=UPI0020CDEA59|nr:hypothetical protein [Ferruginibacter sp. HRS2-29]MCP9751239.1 hypothetical protein [Ferruginibacter sp. HRS2-29]